MTSLYEALAAYLAESGVDRRTAALVAGKVVRKVMMGVAPTFEEAALCVGFLAKISLGSQSDPPDLPKMRHWLPEVDDEVVVAFVNGDARQPIVLGSLWSGKEKACADGPPAGKGTPAGKGIGPKASRADSPAYVRQLAHAIARQPG